MSNFEDELKELEQRNRDNRKRITGEILKRVPLYTGILIALWWMFYGTLDISFNWTIEVISKSIFLTVATIVFAITYCNLIAEGGFRQAEDTEEYKESSDNYKKAVKKGIKKQKEINESAIDIAKSNLKELRRRNLEANFLKYDDFFEENGDAKSINLKERKDLTLHQKTIIKRCMRAHIIVPNLFEGVNGESYFGIRREKTKKEYLAKQQTTKFITRSILSFVSLGVMFNFIGFNINGILFAFFQIALWTASGVSQRISNYRFVLETQMPQLEAKTLIINGYLENHEEGEINGEGNRHLQETIE